MKKIRLLFVAFGLLLTVASSGQTTTLSFKLANPRVLYNDGSLTGLFIQTAGDYFVFDVQIKAADLGTYLFSGQAMFSFSNSYLSPNAVDWYVSKGALSNSLRYTLPDPTIAGSLVNIAWVGSPATLGNASGFKTVTDSYQSVVTVYARIINPVGTAGIDFDQASMNGQQFYKNTASSGYGSYLDPNLYDGSNFMNTYIGRIFANNLWTQIGGSSDVVPFVNWATAVNTSVWDLTATIPAGPLSNASAVRIHSGATLTIPPTGQLTATSLDNNTANGLTIQSDATNAGSLITSTTTGTGTAVVQRYMAANKWHMIAAPAIQDVSVLLSANLNIPTKSGLRGMRDYTTATDSWYNYPTSISGLMEVGKGYLVRTDGTLNSTVNFSGALTVGSTDRPITRGTDFGWNLIGNPFTSAININKGTYIDNNDFFDENSGRLDATYGSLYIWDESVSTTQYELVNRSNLNYVASLGQGFFVKSLASGSTLKFTPAMQTHAVGEALKSGSSAYPEIKLIAQNDNKNISTSIKFIAGTSNGLDPGFDSGFLNLDPSISLYTRLVEDNGVNFALQCLPDNDFRSLIIPVGIYSKVGGVVVFSSDLINLPSDCMVILEDKVSKTFTDLSKNVYQTTIEANSSITDRFQIHTSYQTTGLDIAGTLVGKLSAYSIRNTEIRVKGDVSKQAVATLYDVQGRVVLVKNLEEGNMNIIPTPNIRTGIYMLFVKDNGQKQGFKIPVTE